LETLRSISWFQNIKGKFPCIDVKWGAKVEPKYLKKRIIENQQNIRLRSLVITHVSM
jgi:hypothetical protein